MLNFNFDGQDQKRKKKAGKFKLSEFCSEYPHFLHLFLL